MAVYAVHLSGEAIEASAERLRDQYPENCHYQLSERFYLVTSKGLSRDVARDLGFTSETGDAGAVFKLNAAYAGWDSRAMWEWLATVEDIAR